MSRKYRQQGYQDDDRERDDRAPARRPRRELSAEEKLHRKGLRHALDRDAREVLRCHSCGRTSADTQVGTRSSCPHCNVALHCCRGCRHFDSGARWQCRAEIEAAVSNKTAANECPSFAPSLVLDATGKRGVAGRPSAGGRARPTDARSAFEDLFKK
jgi:hypothetical protein